MKKLFMVMLALTFALTFSLMMFSCDTEEKGDDETSQSSTESSTGSSAQDSTGGSTDSSLEQTPNYYYIYLVDAFGESFEDVADVEVFKNGVSVGEAAVRRGAARFELEKGDYTFILKNLEGDYYYNESACVLNSDSNEATVTVYPYADANDKQELWVPNGEGDHVPYDAVSVGEGGVYVTIDRAEGTYFIFTPTRGGIYRISYESSRSITFGYYGAPHNVLVSCPLDVVDKAFEIEVKDGGINTGSGGTTQIVIGMSSKAVKNCVLKIERIGSATVDLPWVDVTADKGATKADNYINSEFVDFDIKDATLSVVYNEKDGYYHLNSADGPVIYVRISTAKIKSQSDAETVYMYLPSFIKMCETDRLGKVFYDENGSIILKESYNDMFYEYAALAGTSGLYPLNEQLATVIKNIGEYRGWFDLDSELHIFGDEKNFVVKENAWLFACVYENQCAKGTDTAPAVATPTTDDSTTFAALVKGTEYVVVRPSSSAVITIANAQGIKLVLDDGTEVLADAETGVLTAEVGGTKNFKLVNTGDEDVVVRFTLVEKVG